MARFDVFPKPDGPGYLLDCQADILSMLNTRFVVPLLPREEAPIAGRRLNPAFQVEGATVIMYAQFAAAVPRSDLARPVDSLADEHATIMNALDMLLTGY